MTPPWSSFALVLVALSTPIARADTGSDASQKEKRSEKAKLSYLLYLPAGHDKAEKPFPLILFLHGSGERGDDLSRVKRHGPPKLVEKKSDFGFIVVSPQQPAGGRWNPEAILTLLDEVEATCKVDKERIYLTGLSMGGAGTWAVAAAAPKRFAAIAPICGRGDPRTAEKLKGVGIWIFHGAKDRGVPEAEAMVKALKDAGQEVKFTLYPDLGHDCWTVTYDNPDLYKWFLSHTRKRE